MTHDAQQRWGNSLEALRTATEVQSQAAQNFASDEQTLTDLVNNSQSAVGALQATQTTNQLLALQSRQAIQAQQLQITQDRAAALEQARQVAVQERAREVRRRFQGGGTPYTPTTVNFYGN
jgi:P-type conjugative transfer protein TrbJ